MKQLFLTSSISKVAHDIALKLDFSRGNRLVFIDTAAEPKKGDKTWLKNHHDALLQSGFEVERYTITEKTASQLENDLQKYAHIYLSGGDTVYLLQQSQKSGFIPLLKRWVNEEGKTYIGCSAGSIIAGPKVPEYLLQEHKSSYLENSNGYEFVNFTILPHWGRPDFRDKYLKKRLEIAYRENQVPLVLLTDTQYVHVQDEHIEIVDLRQE